MGNKFIVITSANISVSKPKCLVKQEGDTLKTKKLNRGY